MFFVEPKQKILLDIGSSTIKCYRKVGTRLNLFLTRSIPFKQGFNPEGGISEINKKELFELLEAIKAENKDIPVKIYATDLWRRLALKAKQELIDEVFERTGLYFNIISQDLENFYLEVALIGKCHLLEPILLINIGESSGDLVVMYGREAVEKVNIDFGVENINNQFPEINSQFSKVKIENLVNEIKKRLPNLANKPKVAFYTGGELNDPKWMHGARACSAFAQAICEKYGIEKIIPSDSNIINGIIQQEFRYVTISGSFRKHLDYILEVKRFLEKKSTQVLSPKFIEPKNPGDTFVVFVGEEDRTPLQLERHHLLSIEKSDALIVCNPNGYVGASAMLEIGYAHALNKRIIFTEKPEEFILNNLPAEVGL